MERAKSDLGASATHRAVPRVIHASKLSLLTCDSLGAGQAGEADFQSEKGAS